MVQVMQPPELKERRGPSRLAADLIIRSVERDKFDKAIKSAFRRFCSQFKDPETGETLGKDIEIAFRNVFFDFLTPEQARRYFKSKYTARSLFLNSASLLLDQCGEDDPVARARKLKLALKYIDDANKQQWDTKEVIGRKVSFDKLLNEMSSLVRSQLAEVNNEIIHDTVSGSKRQMTQHDKKEFERLVRGVKSESTRQYLADKIWEKRVQFLKYLIKAAAAAAASALLYAAGTYERSAFSNMFETFAGVSALGVAHQIYRAKIEYIKIKATVAVMQDHFGKKRIIEIPAAD